MAEAKPRVRNSGGGGQDARMRVALRYAARGPHTTGRVTLLAIARRPTSSNGAAWNRSWRRSHAEAEALVHAAAKTVNELAGVIPEL